MARARSAIYILPKTLETWWRIIHVSADGTFVNSAGVFEISMCTDTQFRDWLSLFCRCPET